MAFKPCKGVYISYFPKQMKNQPKQFLVGDTHALLEWCENHVESESGAEAPWGSLVECRGKFSSRVFCLGD